MKKILLPAFLVTFLILAYSCHKDNKVIPDDFYFKGQKNGVDWGATANSYNILGDSLKLVAFKQAGEEQINFKIKFKQDTATYVLTGNQAEFFTTIGMDAVTSHYRLDTTQTSTISISSYSKKTNIISGSFTLYLLKDSSDVEYVPLNFTNGLFRVKLPN